MLGPTQRNVSQGGDPAGLEVGAGWVEVALARCQTMGRPYPVSEIWGIEEEKVRAGKDAEVIG